MSSSYLRSTAGWALAVAMGFTGAPVLAQSGSTVYPDHAIRMIAPYASGGVTDIAARYFANLLDKRLGTPVVIENRPGGGGVVGASAVVRAVPDGYTLLFLSGSAVTPIFVKDGAIDPLKELTPVSALHRGAWYLFVSSQLPVKTFAELVAYSKAHPGQLNLGVEATIPMLAMAWVKNRTGLDYVPVKYKSGGGVATALRAGEVQFSLDALVGYVPQMQAGVVRPILISSDSRSPLTPDVPDSAEAGLPGFVAGYLQGIWGPAGLPRDVVAKVSTASQAMLADPEIKANVLKLLGTQALGTTPEEFARLVEAETRFWAEAAQIAHYKPE